MSYLAADAVGVADLAALYLVVAVAGGADLAAYWLAVGLALQVWPALAASPDPWVYPVDPGVTPPGRHIREAKARLML